MIAVLIAALNGIAFMRAYFRLFTGTRHVSSISLEARWPEKIAVLAMTALILGGGLWPQPGIMSRYRAAMEIISQRHQRQPDFASKNRAALATAHQPMNESKQ
jgi:NADH-quinone oxidoreductase subunit M